MDYSLAALKLFCGQLHEARHISSSPPAMTLHDIRFQRAWLQGVLVSGSDEGLFLLDDGSGVVKLSLHAESSPPNWKSGMYVMVVGVYMDGDPPQIKVVFSRRIRCMLYLRKICVYVQSLLTTYVHKIVDLSSNPDRESMWHLEVIEAYKLFYLPETA